MFALALGAILLHLSQALPLNAPLLEQYDYIVVGGGVAGLTVASRLSEDPDVSVLLLEAGPADNNELFIQVPGMIGDGIGSIYDFNLSTVPQTALDGAARSIPQGHGLGGGSLINVSMLIDVIFGPCLPSSLTIIPAAVQGMLWQRGEIGDYDNFVQLGNPGWAWDDLMPYFKRSESYSPISSLEIAVDFSIEANMSVHGMTGPVNVSFAHWFWDTSPLLFSALNELGVPTAYDPNMGQIAGASFLPLSLDPVEATRSTARRAYYDPWVARPNLWVSTGQYVTQILFDGAGANTNATVATTQDTSVGQGASPGIPGGIFGGTTTLNVSRSGNSASDTTRRGVLDRLWRAFKRAILQRQGSGSAVASLRATGVEFAANAQSQRQTVMASREVVIAAGALHSPQLLMLSGVGPADVLQEVGIPVNVNLPGVGSNLHDHGQVWTWYPYNNSAYASPMDFINDPSFAEAAWTDFLTNRTGPLTSGAFDGVAFPALAFIVNGSTAIPDIASAQTASQYLPQDTDPTVVLGFARQLELLISALSDPTRASHEIINGNDGALTVANMRPLSRGTVTVNSSQPFDPPVIDPRYGSNPVDAQVLLAAIRFNQRLITTQSLQELDPVQMYPAADATDDEILQWINTHMQTEYHPAGTCALMPLELGGVVSPHLLVYGTSNLRVVDSSTIPMLPAAHLQAVVYGVAEKAAGIIKAANPVQASTGSSNLQPSSPAATSEGSIVTNAPSLTAAQDQDAAFTTYVTVVVTETVYT